MAGRLVVIDGCSGSGKSSLARALQERLLPQQWLHFSVDTVLYCLPGSILDRANLHNDWTAVDTGAITRGAYGCLDALLAQGHPVLFDCVVMTERRARELLLALRPHRPLLIRLTCSWDEIRRRTLARGDRTLEEAGHGFKTSGLHLVADCELDTTQRTPAELAEVLAPFLLESAEHDGWERSLARLGH
jgi:chloramphenicol 3-O phosphotransferase